MNHQIVTPSILAAIGLLVPILYLAAAAAASVLRDRPLEKRWTLAEVLAGGALGLSLVLAVSGVLTPTVTDALGGVWSASSPSRSLLTLRLDALSGAMRLVVAFVGWVVLRFSRRYLDGDREQVQYLRRLLVTLAVVSALVSVDNLLFIALLWTGTGLCLHGLLTHVKGRVQATMAAHKKFLLSRLADLFVLVALALLASDWRTLELEKLFGLVQQQGRLPGATAWACGLIAVATLLKCAQLPFHGWLIQVMEAPTPVSALLHAGIVNIGGYVLIRLAPLMSRAEEAQMLLLIVGCATTLLAGLVAQTRISIKVMLAWSTCAQMGMMLVECALGAYEMALLHLVGHSLYKAHAFLSAGSTVAQYRASALTAPMERSGLLFRLAAGAVALIGVVAVGRLVGIQSANVSAPAFTAVLLAVALPELLARRSSQPMMQRLGTPLVLWSAVALTYVLGHVAVAEFLGVGGHGSASRSSDLVAAIVLAGLFLVQTWVRERPASPLSRWLQPRAFAGFYLDELVTRFLFRLWPTKPGLKASAELLVSTPTESVPQ